MYDDGKTTNVALLTELRKYNATIEEQRVVRDRYTDPELKVFDNLIQTKLNELIEEIRLVDAIIKNGNAVGKFEGWTIGKIKKHAKTLFKKNLDLLAAQSRVMGKNYGICRRTNRLIPKDYLIICPTATFYFKN